MNLRLAHSMIEELKMIKNSDQDPEAISDNLLIFIKQHYDTAYEEMVYAFSILNRLHQGCYFQIPIFLCSGLNCEICAEPVLKKLLYHFNKPITQRR